MIKILLPLIFLPVFSFAAVVQKVDDDDLPSEVVSPRVDYPDSVLHKAINFEGKIEFGTKFVFVLNEPFYSGQGQSFFLGTHLTEAASIFIHQTTWNQGLSTYSNALAKDTLELRFDRVPRPKTSLGIGGEYAFFYGKISFDRNVTLRTTAFGESGVSQTIYGTKNYLGLRVAFGQKLFLTKNIGLRATIEYLNQQQPNVFSTNLKSTSPVPTEDDFGKTSRSYTVISLGFLGIF